MADSCDAEGRWARELRDSVDWRRTLRGRVSTLQLGLVTLRWISYGWEQASGKHNVRGIHVARVDDALLVVVRPLQNGPTPLPHKALGHALDLGLCALCLCIEEHDAADATGQERLLLDLQLGEGREDLALDVVGRKLTIIAQRFQEELDRLQEVCLGVENGVLDVLPVEQGHHFGQHLDFLDRGKEVGHGFVVNFAGFLHAGLDVGDMLVEFLLEVLESLLIYCF